MDGTGPATPDDLDRLEAVVDDYLALRLSEDPAVAAVERGEPGQRRWYVRILGEAKDVYSVWLTLGQRTLHYETYFMPAPEENAEAVYRQLLVRNAKLYGLAFSIGQEDAVFLAGQLGNESVDAAAVDRVLGSIVAAVELCFQPAIRLAFASKFAPPDSP
jgi:hypothetical protein